jgi:hypothetical protein
METSSSIAAIAEALAKFQAEVPAVTKDAKANYGKYATLQNVIETIKKPLSDQGLSYSQFPDQEGFTTIIMHKSGEWIKCTAKLYMDKQTAQGQGSAITYMRRYALSAALGIAADDDDDGAEASKPTASKPAPAPAKTAPKKAVDPVIATKQKLQKLVNKLEGAEFKGEELVAKIVQHTGLEVKPDNFDDIIARLEALIDERNQK